MKQYGLIDADILCYRIGFGYENETSDKLVRWQVDRTIATICDKLDITDYQTFLTATDKSNFRYKVDKTYKGHRTQPRPKWFDVIREHLINDYMATVVVGREADDAIGIAATAGYVDKEGIIISTDKDLDQIPGHHYNMVKSVSYVVSNDGGNFFLGQQLLTGDRTDNVKGLRGIGPTKAKRILASATTREEILIRVMEAYRKAEEFKKGNRWQKELQRVADLIFIQRTGEERLVIPFDLLKQQDEVV